MASKRQKSLPKILGIQVRRYRAEAGLTQDQLADRCDLSRDMVSRIERGTISCSLGTIAKLAEVLSVQPAILFGGVSLSESAKSPREKALQQTIGVLTKAETSDLEWITEVVRSLVQRPK